MFIRTVYANQKGFWARILWLSSKAIFGGSLFVDEGREEEKKQQLEADIRQSIDPKSDTGLVLQKVVKQVGFPQVCSTEKEEKKLNLPFLRTNTTTELPPQTTGKNQTPPKNRDINQIPIFAGKRNHHHPQINGKVWEIKVGGRRRRKGRD